MEFKIIENTLNRVKVSVKIIKRSLAVDPNTHVDTQDVADFLKREGVDFANCIGETVLDNYSDNPKLEGEWVFNKNVQVPTQKKRKTNVPVATGTTKRRRKPKTKTEPQKNQLLRTENME
jgi:hypothetical protein